MPSFAEQSPGGELSRHATISRRHYTITAYNRSGWRPRSPQATKAAVAEPRGDLAVGERAAFAPRARPRPPRAARRRPPRCPIPSSARSADRRPPSPSAITQNLSDEPAGSAFADRQSRAGTPRSRRSPCERLASATSAAAPGGRADRRQPARGAERAPTGASQTKACVAAEPQTPERRAHRPRRRPARRSRSARC